MRDRRRQIERLNAVERELAVERARPVERSLPALAVHDGPRVREPQVVPAIPAFAHELQIFAVRDEPIRERERFDEQAMARRLVVEAEVLPGRADFTQPPLDGQEPQRRGPEAL
jgi:hypothetical protein